MKYNRFLDLIGQYKSKKISRERFIDEWGQEQIYQDITLEGGKKYMYSVSYNGNKKLFSVYKDEKKIAVFKTEPEAWNYIQFLITSGRIFLGGGTMIDSPEVIKQAEKSSLFDEDIVGMADAVRRQAASHGNYETIRLLAGIIRRYVPDSAERGWALEILESD
jgi:hypothetical protein